MTHYTNNTKNNIHADYLHQLKIAHDWR